MANELLKSTTSDANYSTGWPSHTFQLASFFSNSSKFTVIDSYSALSTPQRYKGDPITNGSWADAGDIDEDNSWFIVQSETWLTSQHQALQRWQVKFQCVDTAGFEDPSDPSGTTYTAYHGATGEILWRFSPYGGWDLEDTTPDFNPSGGQSSFDNISLKCGHGGTGNDTRWYLVAGDGWICKFNRNNEDALEFWFWGGFIGDFYPIDSDCQPMPRCIIGDGPLYISGLGDQYGICRNVNYADSIGFVNENLELVKTRFSIAFPYGLSWQLNAYASREKDLFSYIVTPKYEPFTSMGYTDNYAFNGPIGIIPALAIGRGVGMQPCGDKEWLSTTQASEGASNILSLYFRWDESSDLP
jgi:hypothetical protein